MFVPGALAADPPAQSPENDKAAIVAAARENMGTQTYCALATVDETGRAQVRTMNPFPHMKTWWCGRRSGRWSFAPPSVELDLAKQPPMKH